ncbi:alpha/beta-hydrolase [Aulographum hederae CBS 113979]|uniref:Alpha/beta-hydrolase n=1 Tax=Aulographum hederae CBS 113979 TaxID=1176131 RepID=A0A6G1GS56_9PEZI|nr:alpha/beta-hydrolase [Aulographum hederae CBS 113979]
MVGFKSAILSGLLASTAFALPTVGPEPLTNVGTSDPWDPASYQKTFITCPAVDRSGPTPKDIQLRLGYIDVNPTAEKTLVLAHGWPSMWTTYRKQIEHFGKDYHLIIPEHRGFGDSEHPRDLNASNTMQDFMNDMICMMDHAKASSGVCVGNDFGAQLCWEAGRARPDKFIAVFNVGIPYVTSSTMFVPTLLLSVLNPSFGYQVYLSEAPEKAAAEMDADPLSVIRATAQVAQTKVPENFLKLRDGFLQPWLEQDRQNNYTEVPFSGIMSKKVEDYMVSAYRKQGFLNTFNGYQYGNRKLTYDYDVAQGNFSLPQPTFTLFPTKDPVSNWEEFAVMLKSSDFLPNTKNATIETAHWPHEEKPEEFNKILEDWLNSDVKF